ncbi:MAG: gliding motility-associated ABC transporter permease subunit GldF [Bacteroidota bacterium]|nr:gliding motility-associated ABC transporter permease subunit GldF [Bacteroidota bacterium]
MKALLLREINTFFGSLMGYLVISIFLLLNGLFLWVFEGNFNILDNSFADLIPFFTFTPWILLFLIPAVTMRSFADERKQGTIELLLTKPLSIWQIVGGKFLGSFLLILLALLPTLIYVYVIYDLVSPPTIIDSGSIIGSYFGLLFLVCGYTAIGIFTSSITENQIIAFILAVLLCFVFYFGLEGLASMFSPYNDLIASLGMDYHYKSISRGVIDTRDLIYFVSITFLFLSFTAFKLNSLKNQ